MVKKAKVPSPKKNLKIQKQEAVRLAIEQIEKQYGKGAIMRLGDQSGRTPIDVISTGCLPLDLALGVGGLPRSRVVEIYGPEASGKTSLCLHVIAQAQKNGGTAAFVDVEHALDPKWAETIGVKTAELLISQPDTGEQALEIVETLVRSNAVDVIVIDSVAALVPRAEIEGEMGDSMMGVQARLMSQALRKLTGAINRSKTLVIFTNQIRHKIGILFGNPETTPGGLALKFYSSVRIDIRKIAAIKTTSGEILGTRHRARVKKNKVAPPLKEAEFDVLADEGISWEAGVLDIATDRKLIDKSGAFYKLGDKVIGQGREAAKEYLKTHPELTQKLVEKIAQGKQL